MNKIDEPILDDSVFNGMPSFFLPEVYVDTFLKVCDLMRLVSEVHKNTSVSVFIIYTLDEESKEIVYTTYRSSGSIDKLIEEINKCGSFCTYTSVYSYLIDTNKRDIPYKQMAKDYYEFIHKCPTIEYRRAFA